MTWKYFGFFISLIDVEPRYSGSRIEGDTITLDFVKKMMNDFKEQKCLDRGYWSNKIFFFVKLFVLLLKCCWNVFAFVLVHCFRYASKILLQTKKVLKALPSLVDITVPNGKHVTVCGDVHGQVIGIWQLLPWFIICENNCC
jgi:serine/threonine-protein phosphatase 5